MATESSPELTQPVADDASDIKTPLFVEADANPILDEKGNYIKDENGNIVYSEKYK